MRDFLQLYAATGFDETRKTECAIKAGYKGDSAVVSANRVLEHPAFRDLINQELDIQGISAPRLVRKIDELLECKHPLAPEMPDNKEQRETLKMTIQIRDGFPPKKVDIRKVEARYDLTKDDKERLDGVDWGEDAVDGEVVEEEEVIEPI